jgi:hypothetical protein
MQDTYVDDSQPESEWVTDARWEADSWAAVPWARGLIPQIGIPMASQGENADQSFQNIISGSEDSIFNGIFQAWANDGYKQLSIRPGYEMNGSTVPWAVTAANASDYVAAFQHIASLAHAFSGASIQVVWNPGVGSTPVPIADLYPGNAAADVIGLDTYGEPVNYDGSPGDTSTSSSDVTLTDVLAMAKANGKPFALPETGGVDPSFPSALASTIAQSGVQVAFMNIWDVNDGSSDQTWSNDAATAAAWKQAFATISGNSGSTSSFSDPAPSSPSNASASSASDSSASTPAASPSSSPTVASPASISVTNNATGAVKTIDATTVHTESDFGATFKLTAPGVAEVTLGGRSDTLNFVGLSGVTLTAGSAAATATADGGTNAFTAGAGALDVTGGAGADTYMYHSGDALLTVTDFSAAKGDVLQVDAALQGSLATTSDGQGGTMLTFGTAGGGIDLKGVGTMPAENIAWS